MKRAVAIILAFVFCMCSALCVGANEEISVIIDGVNQNYDVMPLIISDRTLVPVRFVSETLGCSVQWKAETKTVVITTGGNEDEAKKLYDEMNLTDIILDEKTFFSNGALGGISVTTYLPKSQEGYYEKTLERCKEAQKYGTIKGIIWLQGAADVNKPEYINWLGQMVESFKKDLNLSSLPVIAGEILNTFPERVEFNKKSQIGRKCYEYKSCVKRRPCRMRRQIPSVR